MSADRIVTAARELRRQILPGRLCYSTEGLNRAIDNLVEAVDDDALNAFQPSRGSEIAAQLATARLVDGACVNPNDCCGWCQADETEKAVRQHMSELAARDNEALS